MCQLQLERMVGSGTRVRGSGLRTCADGQVGPHGRWDGQAACMEGGTQGVGQRGGGGW